ncbi:hypothetical protein AB0K40_17635 [Nonomuraea bangladeshensis]|uniref:Uncharacterized protein n=1 Tax=Nonomuraea bangladeshensis TaxID=404385 RepID=A0ABV3H484_9ACTN
MKPDQGLYSWEASDKRRQRGSCGVATDPRRAEELLQEALDRLAPGARGSVQFVQVDHVASHPSYVGGRVLARVRHGDRVVIPAVAPR